MSHVCVCAGRSVCVGGGGGWVCVSQEGESGRRKNSSHMSSAQLALGAGLAIVHIATPVIFWSAPLPCRLSVLIVILRKGNMNLEGVVCVSSKFISV